MKVRFPKTSVFLKERYYKCMPCREKVKQNRNMAFGKFAYFMAFNINIKFDFTRVIFLCSHWFCNYISVLQIIGILVVSLHLVATSEICSPCVYGILTKSNHAERSCDHAVPVDSITSSLNTTINKFNLLIQSIVSTQSIIS